jgi:hypothetical protein
MSGVSIAARFHTRVAAILGNDRVAGSVCACCNRRKYNAIKIPTASNVAVNSALIRRESGGAWRWRIAAPEVRCAAQATDSGAAAEHSGSNL